MMMLAYAQETQAAGQTAAATQQSPLLSLMPIILIFVVFYFLLIRPQKKAQQEHAKMLESLKKNDEVITSGGIHGTIVNLQNDVITLRVDDNTRIKVQKGHITTIKRAKQDKGE